MISFPESKTTQNTSSGMFLYHAIEQVQLYPNRIFRPSPTTTNRSHRPPSHRHRRLSRLPLANPLHVRLNRAIERRLGRTVCHRAIPSIGLTLIPRLSFPQLDQPLPFPLMNLPFNGIVRPFWLRHVAGKADAETGVAFLGAACFIEDIGTIAPLLAVFAGVAACDASVNFEV